MIAIEEFASKLKAAADERFNKDFVIIARTDARAIEGVTKAIDRCRYYIEAGADVIFFEAPQSVAEIEIVAKELASDVPLLINMATGGKTPTVRVKELAEMGYKVAIFPGVCMFTALLTMREALAYLKKNGTDDGVIQGKFGPVDLFLAVGLEKWLEKEKHYAS